MGSHRLRSFSLRSLFVVTALVAIGCAIGRYKIVRYEARQRQIDRIAGWGGGDNVTVTEHAKTWLPLWISDEHSRCVSTIRIGNANNAVLTDADVSDLHLFGEITTLKLFSHRITDETALKLRSLPKLEILDLSGSRITDVGLRALVDCRNLRDLELSGTCITDEGLSVVAGLPHLESVTLESCRVSSAGLMHLGHCAQLRWLDLSSTHVDDRGLAELAQCKSLERLDLDRTLVTDVGLEFLGRMPNLRHVNLAGTQTSATAVRKLRTALPLAEVDHYYSLDTFGEFQMKLLKLREQGTTMFTPGMDFSWGNRKPYLSDRYVEELSTALPNLLCAYLDGQPVTDVGLKHLADLRQVETLNLSRTYISSRGVSHLASLESLKSLDLSRTLVDDAIFARLAGAVGLESLNLDSDQYITGNGIGRLRGLPRLQRLYLNETSLSDEALAEIARFPALEELNIKRTLVTDKGIAHLHRSRSLRKVRIPSDISTPAVERLRAALPELIID